MAVFLLWLILIVLCWPLAIRALLLYPIFLLTFLPFRLFGIAVNGVFSMMRAIVLVPFRVLRRKPRRQLPEPRFPMLDSRSQSFNFSFHSRGIARAALIHQGGPHVPKHQDAA